jgi:hypothetical protein
MATYVGAAPISRQGFTFINNEFFAESSTNQNRHRRATLAELKAHFDSGSDKDKPAHWFEAQLIHYGLQPSKTKAVARMRLFDAVREEKLAVPGWIGKLETEMKKEWTKSDRDAKKGIAATSKTGARAKRKAEEDVKDAPVKKAKTAPTKAAKPKPVPASKPTATPKKAAEKKPAEEKVAAKTATPKQPTDKKPAATKASEKKLVAKKPAEKKQTARRGGLSHAPPQPSPQPCMDPPVGRTKQTARRGGLSQTPSTRAPSAEASAPRAPRTKQTARRSAPFMGGRIQGRSPSEPPPPYSEFDGGLAYYDDEDENDNDGYGNAYYDDEEPTSLAPLGLLNGRYTLTSDTVSGEWPNHGDEFELTLTLAGQELWGSFDLGIVAGVLRIAQRPFLSSTDKVPFRWRGTEENGPIHYSDSETGWIRFLGGGRIEGRVDFMSIDFRGERDPGQGTRSDVEVRQMREEWNGYNEREYERANRARW